MKNLTIIFIFLLGGLCYGYDFNQQQIEFPQAAFNSVNKYNSCTNYSPNIAPVGAKNVYNSTIQQRGYRRSDGIGYGSYEGGTFATPVGDYPIWLLVLFAVGYCYYKKRKTVSV